MKKGAKVKPEEIIAILRQVEVLINQGKNRSNGLQRFWG